MSEDLENRIARAEQRLLAREADIGRRIGLIDGRVRDALQPQRLLLPALGTAATLLSLWLLLRGRAPLPAAAAAAPEHHTEVPWVSLVALVWPMLPERWRDRVSAGTATTIASIGMPLVNGLLRRLRRPRAAAQPG